MLIEVQNGNFAKPMLPAVVGSSKKYSVIYADPAWEYNTKECLAKTSILNGELNTHYSTMTLKELKALEVQSISDKNCMLFLCVVRRLDCLKILNKNVMM